MCVPGSFNSINFLYRMREIRSVVKEPVAIYRHIDLCHRRRVAELVLTGSPVVDRPHLLVSVKGGFL